MQQAISENVAALGVACQLHFVDCDEIDIDVARHGFNGANPIPRTFRLDFFLAGHERYAVNADAGNDLVVDFPRKKPKRQPDQAGAVTEHTLDC